MPDGMTVLYATSYRQNVFYLKGDELTPDQRVIVERDWGPVRDDVYYCLGERIEGED